MIKNFVLFLFLGLAACEHPKPEVQVQQIYCLTPDQYRQLVEKMPGTINDQLTGNAQKDFILVGNSAVLLRLYANGLIKVLGGCTAPAPLPAA